VALSEVHAGPVDTTGEVAPDDPNLAVADWSLATPLAVRGRFSGAGEGKYYWRVQFETRVRLECRRCLVGIELPISESRGLVFAADEETPDGDGCYTISPRTRVLDLTETLREELILAVPPFVECRPDCKGLCPRCGANLNDGPCDCPPRSDPRWDALKGLPTADTRKD
ncbi:MAG: YceD family protein, partial [Gemmatimonadales bacterium]